MISIDKFACVLENAPLVSIDFIVEYDGRYLLGRRNNAPAKGYWFTLGGRIFKNESIKQAIMRLAHKELGLDVSNCNISFLGVFEHFYNESFVGEEISTHYVVLAYKLSIHQTEELPTDEHHAYHYFSKQELLDDSDVHPYVKDYFRSV
ncbi:MAG: GDP-mannose mannosyl hydrolase [Sulfurovum sp. PC08-66]|nr:MAG: GDP-mannose mannosyl hydrolase [Sulfurovum sp. PC08-66]KIM12462.1 MAG: GDP-mannose mannosyl hydrolase [Sulfuricurvum sp. PC08-66]